MTTNLSQNSKQKGMVISVRTSYLSSGYYFSLVFIGYQGTGGGGGERGALRSKVTGVIKKEQESKPKISLGLPMKPPKFPGRKITYSPYHLNLPFLTWQYRTTRLAYAQSTPIVRLLLNTPKKSLLKSKHRKKGQISYFIKKNLNGIFKPTENPFRPFFHSPKNPT